MAAQAGAGMAARVVVLAGATVVAEAIAKGDVQAGAVPVAPVIDAP